jgi:hypothetical protein
LHLPPSILRERYAAWCCDAFDPSGDIDAIAEDIVVFDDDVADIDANAELDRIGFGATGVVLSNVLLDLDRTGDRVDGAAELHQYAVAHQLDNPARMGSDRRIDEAAPQCLQALQCADFVDPHEARVAHHISGQDCCESQLKALLGQQIALLGKASIRSDFMARWAGVSIAATVTALGP